MPYALANPQTGVVNAGSATVSEVGKTVTVDQSSAKAVIDWGSFNISADETTRFNQPSSSSITLNRIGGASASQVMGTLSANGNIILINPNGVLFGANSRVDVNSLIATTANISNADFMAGNMNFTSAGSNPNASITNQGTITAADAGLVGLVAPNVTNSGVITARLGKVHLASGNSFTLDLYGDGLLEIGVSSDVSRQVVQNTGTINASGGLIKMTAAAGRQVVNSLIKVEGQLNAPSVAQKNGKIYIYAEGSNGTSKSGSSSVQVSGKLDVSGKGNGETGGQIDVLGDNVSILSGATLDASGNAGGGTIRIGGDYQGRGTAQNSIHTLIEGNSFITADAIASGNGGKVIAWADDTTNFNGKISAQGGANGGNGGFVETSGKNILGVGGEVNASSALGEAGSWLLDPENVIIQATGTNTNVTGNPNFVTTGASSTNAIVTTGSIQTALNSGTSVNVMTGNSGDATKLGDITVNSSITKTSGGNATLTLKAVGSIIVNAGANITSTSNNLNVVLNSNSLGSTTTGGAISITGATINTNGGDITMGGGANAATAAYGTSVYKSGILLSGATLTSGGGNITLRGNGYNNTSSAANNVGVNITAGSVITSTNGNINISGSGGNNSTTGNIGVVVTGANSAIQSTGSGNITVTGTGGNGTNTNYGVYVAAAGKINMSENSTGNLTVTGTGGTGGVTTKNISNYGIFVTGAGSQISSSKTSGAGTMTVTGIGANGYGNNYGVNVVTGGSISTIVDNLTVTGTGRGVAATNYGVYVTGAGAFINSTGTGALNVTGVGGNGTSANAGVVVGAAGKINTNTSNLNILGTGGNATTTNNYGVWVTGSGSSIASTSGAVSVIGSGGTGTAANYGVFVQSAGLITTGSNTLNVTGTGGNGTGDSNFGVYVSGANSAISSTTGGILTVTGFGSGRNLKGEYSTASTSGATNYGVVIGAAGGIKTTSGNLIVSGYGGNGKTINNYGVYVTGASSVIQSTGAGDVTVNGVGGNGTINNAGVYVAAAGKINLASTSSGNLTVTGTGGVGASGTINNYGVFITGSGSAISSSRATGSGAITINGTGGNGTTANYGVGVAAGGGISTISDNLIINGYGGDGTSTVNYGVYLAGAVTSTGAGNITINSSGKAGAINNASSNAQDIYLASGGAITGKTGLVTLNTSGTGVINVAAAQTIKTAGGAITLNGLIILGNTLSVDTTSAGTNTIGGNITFAKGVTGAKAVTITAGTGGVTSFDDVVGGTFAADALGVLKVTSGGGIILKNNISASSVVLNSATTLSTNAITLDTTKVSAAGGAVTFGSTINGAQNLTIKSGTAGIATFNGIVGGTTAIGALDVTGAGVTLKNNINASSMSFSGPITLSTNAITLNTNQTNANGGNVTFGGTINGALALTINAGTTGITTFNGIVGGTTALGALNVNAGSIMLKNSINASSMSFASPVTLANTAITLDTTKVRAAGGAVTFGGNVDGAQSLTIKGGTAGITTFNGVVGGTTAVGALNVTAGSIALKNNINASSMSFTGPVALSTNAITLDTTKVSAAGGAVTFGSTINGAQNLTIKGGTAGIATFNGIVGGTTAIGALDVTGGGITLKNNINASSMSFSGPITLSTNAITLNTNQTNANGGNVTFGGTINGALALTINAGTTGITTFNGIVGGTTGLGALKINSGGGITFNKNIKAATILADTTRGTNGDIVIGSGVTLNATAASNAAGVTNKATIVLASGRNFINNSGSSALSLTGASAPRWLIYSSNPANDVLGGLARPTKRYNKTYAGYSPASVTETGNVFFYSVAPVLTVTAANASKIYGDAVPTLTETITGLIDGDLASAAYTGTIGTPTTTATSASNVGTYGITATSGTLAATALGYQIQYVGGTLTVNPAQLSVAANASSKTYGDVDNLTYAASGFKNGDSASVLSGNLSRASGENVGSYAIAKGTVSAGSNYVVNYTGNNLVINKAALTIAANASSKIYGDADALSYSASGLKFNDTVSGSLSRAAGENVGSYAILQGSVDVGAAVKGNYNVTYTGNNLTINAATLTIAANASSKTYGDADNLTYAASGFKNGDSASVLSGNLSRASGENVGSYAIAKGTVSAGSNYVVNYTGNNLVINKAALTIAANASSKIYGDADALSYSASGLKFNDTVSGSLSRASGENVGSYAILQGSVDVGAAVKGNYNVTYTGNNLTINAATLTIAANASSKTYGDADNLTYAASGFKNGDSASVLSGNLSRASGENVGSYAIAKGTISAGSNYVVNYTGNNLVINKAALTIAANASSKIYGDADALSYSASGLKFNDTVSGSLSRAAGENVGSYAILQGSVDVGAAVKGNYNVTYTGNNLTINAATLTIAANASSKTYGDADNLTYAASGFKNGDSASVLSGNLSRASGENVGSYAIAKGTVSAGSNYVVNYTGNNLVINKAALTIAANASSKIYGDADALSYSASGLKFNDTVSGSLSRAAGENVGSYAILQGSVDVGAAVKGNYNVTYTGNNLTINAATLTIAANASSKTYGDADNLTYAASGFKNGDSASVLSGNLSRASGENVGSYAIAKGTVSAGSNYVVNYTGNNLVINKAALTIAANASSKIYGDADALSYSASGLKFNDTVSGSLSRAAGENVGSYAILQGSVDVGAAVKGNYNVTYTGNNLTINAATLTIAANASSKTYGDADNLTYAASGFKNGDSASVLSGNLSRASGENVGSYAIAKGTVSAGSNYVVNYTGNNLVINKAALTIAANASSKIYGDADALSYSASGLKFNDTVSGSLSRAAGENVGSYAILQGSVDVGAAVKGNYNVTYTGNNLTINAATLTIAANASSKTYGDADNLTYAASGFKNGDSASVLSGNLSRASGENVGSYAIAKGTVSAGSNYVVNYTGNNLVINKAALTIAANASSKIYGDADALSYSASGLKFNDTVSGSLSRAAGENVGSYAILQGSVDVGAAVKGNYNVTYTGNNLTINAATLTIAANASSKTYGDADNLTYAASGFKNGDSASVLSGNLSRASGENVGSYAIAKGTVSAGSNYVVNYTGNNLTITPATLLITASAGSKFLGEADPKFSYNANGLKNNDTATVLNGELNRVAGENVGIYQILKGTLTAGSNYLINYIGNNFTIKQSVAQVNLIKPSIPVNNILQDVPVFAKNLEISNLIVKEQPIVDARPLAIVQTKAEPTLTLESKSQSENKSSQVKDNATLADSNFQSSNYLASPKIVQTSQIKPDPKFEAAASQVPENKTFSKSDFVSSDYINASGNKD